METRDYLKRLTQTIQKCQNRIEVGIIPHTNMAHRREKWKHRSLSISQKD